MNKILLLIFLLLLLPLQALALTPSYTLVEGWDGSQTCTGTNVLCAYNPVGSVSDNYSILFSWNMIGIKQRLIVNYDTNVGQPYIMDIGSKTDTNSNLNYVRYWDGSTNEKFNSSAMCGFGDTATYNYRLNFYDNNTFNIFKDGVLCYKRNNLITNPFIEFDQLAGGWSESTTVTMFDIKIFNISLSVEDINFSVSLNNDFNGTALSNFSIFLVNETGKYNFNVISETLTLNISNISSGVFNITYFKQDYFNRTYNNINISSIHVGSVFQSIINFSAFQQVTNNTLSNYSVTLNGSLACNTTGSNCLSNPNAGTYNLLLKSNDDSFQDTSSSVTITPLLNTTINLVGGQFSLNITAVNKITGATISNFTITIDSYNSTDIRSNFTSQGLSIFSVINETYKVNISAPGFALFNSSLNVSVTGDKLITFNLYTTNSLNITFINFDTNTKLIGQNITVQFIGETNQTNVTSTSTLYADLFSPDEYTILYDAEGFRQGKYILQLNNRTHNELTLYLQNDTGTQLILIKVEDRFGSPVKGAEVTIQRWVNNFWKTDQIVKTDFQGQSEASYILSTVFYNHIISINGVRVFGNINDNNNKKIIYAEDVTNGLTFSIDTTGNKILPEFFDANGVFVNLSFVNTSNSTGTFRFEWDDPDNNQFFGCLNVYKGSNRESVCTDDLVYCVTAESAIIPTCNVNFSVTNVYFAEATLNGHVVGSITRRLVSPNSSVIDWGATGYIVAFLVLIVSFFIFIGLPSMSIFFGTIMLIIMGLTGVIFKDVDYGVYMVLIVIAYLVASVKSSSGVEG